MATRDFGPDTYLAAAEDHAQKVRLFEERIGVAQRHVQNDLNALRLAVEKGWQELARVLIPTIDQPTLDGASRGLGLPTISTAAVNAWAAHVHANLAQERASLLTSDMITQRQSIVQAAQSRISAIQSEISVLESQLALFEKVPRWRELITLGYDRPEYKRSWIQLAYYRDWKYGDLAVERLGSTFQAKTFSELRTAYENTAAELEQAILARSQAQAQVTSTQEAMQKVEQLDRKLNNFASECMNHVLTLVMAHLRAQSPSDVMRVLAGSALASSLYAKIDAQRKKITYLESIHETWIEPTRAQMQKWNAKIGREASKLRNPKKYRRFTQDELETRFSGNHNRWREDIENFERHRAAILAFESYHLFAPAAGFSWWSVMTGEEREPKFIANKEKAQSTAIHGERVDDAHFALAVESALPYDTRGDFS